ncbi:hypothetical protein ZTR_08864 [Talaromyces verruculosus]|nr:hypothetical protein ZTR_08864 [Talaromyces verruculosus]
MLRRKPTAITITPEDLIAFEEERLQKLEQEAANKLNAEGGGEGDARSESTLNMSSKKYDPNDELKPLPGDKARIVRSRDERIGVGRRT